MTFTTPDGVFHQICDWQIGVNGPAFEENESSSAVVGMLGSGGRDTIILRPQERFDTIAAASWLR